MEDPAAVVVVRYSVAFGLLESCGLRNQYSRVNFDIVNSIVAGLQHCCTGIDHMTFVFVIVGC